jgi:hypothetical protein
MVAGLLRVCADPGKVGMKSDRRRSCRYAALVSQVELSWDNEGTAAEVEATLVNVSNQGCLVATPRRATPSPGTIVQLSASFQSMDFSTGGRIISVEKRIFRKRLVRVYFPRPLPFDLFKLLVYGPDSQAPAWEARPDHEKDYFWR